MNESRDRARKIPVLDDEKQPPAAVLTSPTIRVRQYTLLIEIAEYREAGVGVSGYPNLGVIPIGDKTLESNGCAIPSAGRCDIYGTRRSEASIPTINARSRGRGLDCWIRPPGRRS